MSGIRCAGKHEVCGHLLSHAMPPRGTEGGQRRSGLSFDCIDLVIGVKCSVADSLIRKPLGQGNEWFLLELCPHLAYPCDVWVQR